MLKTKYIIAVLLAILAIYLQSCSTQKNTKTTRFYHAVNTRYNIYFNAEQAYIEALKAKQTEYKENLSELLFLEPFYDEQDKISGFDVTIDKCTKAIKIHSIQAKPDRDPSKRGNLKYQEWLQQKEFNPFLENVWLLMAKAEYQSLDYMRSISTFSYITRLYKHDPEIVAEARLWMAQAYTQLGWYYEADNIFHKIKLEGGVPNKYRPLFASTYANYLIRHKDYQAAIPYLEEAVRREKGHQKMRFKYLLGQLYEMTGDKPKAFLAFGRVEGLNTPHEYSFNAKLKQAQNSDSARKPKMLSMLNSMSNSSKNKQYLDQIYFVKGNLFLQDQDTLKAVENYNLAVKKSTRNGYDKAVVALVLADIYFKQREYVKAQPLYSEVLSVLSKKDDRYFQASLRSEVLDGLVVYVEAIHLQDSLQHLAKLPEVERLFAIDKLIAGIKKKDEEDRKLAEGDNKMQANGNALFDDPMTNRPNVPSMPQFGSDPSTFYFYNSQVVSQGKVAFQKRWGNRKLEDNWRLKNKHFSTFDDFDLAEDTKQPDVNTDVKTNDRSDINNIQDKYSPDFYLQQLPFTIEAIAESNAIIDDAYFQMGGIYKNKLEDLYLAIDAYETAIRRFPQTSNLEEIYYQLFLLYSQINNKNKADLYRNKLISEFSGGDYATTLSDPNYEENLRNLGSMQNALYEQTYELYLAGNKKAVRDNFQLMSQKYPLSKLMPKFMFLNALTYAQTNDADVFKEQLKVLVDKYSQEDVAILAGDILKGLLDGRQLAVDGKPMRGMIWDIRFGGDEVENDTTLTFADNQEDEYLLLLIYQSKTVSKNDLIYNVASYNFSNFLLQTFDLSFSNMQSLEMLQVKGFKSFSDIEEYLNKGFEDNSLISQIDSTIVPLPISVGNYNSLMKGKSMGEYFEFFENNYGKQMPKLIKHWAKQIETSLEDEEEVVDTIVAKEVALDQDSSVAVTPEIRIKTGGVKLNPVDMRKPELNKSSQGIAGDNKNGISVNADDLVKSKAVDTAVDVANDLSNIANNPVDGIKNVINSIKNKPKLTKEEKAAAKEEKNRLKAIEKERISIENARQDSINRVNKIEKQAEISSVKMVQDSIQALERVKIEEKANAKNAKEDARKERARQLKEKERTRNELLKQKEKERKERLKQREEERKAKEKERRTKISNKR